jgi:hypothetical protein
MDKKPVLAPVHCLRCKGSVFREILEEEIQGRKVSYLRCKNHRCAATFASIACDDGPLLFDTSKSRIPRLDGSIAVGSLRDAVGATLADEKQRREGREAFLRRVEAEEAEAKAPKLLGCDNPRGCPLFHVRAAPYLIEPKCPECHGAIRYFPATDERKVGNQPAERRKS